jgi:hypothetical protein
MDLPNEYTLDVIEKRKEYLIEKIKNPYNKNGFIMKEIKALDRVINLLKLIQNGFSDDLIKKIIEEKLIENDNVEKKDNDKRYNILYSYEQEMTKNSKLDISFSEQYIHIALKKYNLLQCIYQGKIKFTPSMLEGILKKAYEVGIK